MAFGCDLSSVIRIVLSICMNMKNSAFNYLDKVEAQIQLFLFSKFSVCWSICFFGLLKYLFYLLVSLHVYTYSLTLILS